MQGNLTPAQCFLLIYIFIKLKTCLAESILYVYTVPDSSYIMFGTNRPFDCTAK